MDSSNIQGGRVYSVCNGLTKTDINADTNIVVTAIALPVQYFCTGELKRLITDQLCQTLITTILFGAQLHNKSQQNFCLQKCACKIILDYKFFLKIAYINW